MHLAHDNFVKEIENFIINRFSTYFKIASMGWRYALEVEGHYLSKFDDNKRNLRTNYLGTTKSTKDDFQLQKPELSD